MQFNILLLPRSWRIELYNGDWACWWQERCMGPIIRVCDLCTFESVGICGRTECGKSMELENFTCLLFAVCSKTAWWVKRLWINSMSIFWTAYKCIIGTFGYLHGADWLTWIWTSVLVSVTAITTLDSWHPYPPCLHNVASSQHSQILLEFEGGFILIALTVWRF